MRGAGGCGGLGLVFMRIPSVVKASKVLKEPKALKVLKVHKAFKELKA